MNAHVLNASLLIGLLLVSAGALLWNVPFGLASTGGLLILLSLYVARLAGVYVPKGD